MGQVWVVRLWPPERGKNQVSDLTEGSWKVDDNPVVVGFIASAVALFALFGWRPSSDVLNTATDVISGAAYLYAMFEARSKVSPV